MRAAARWRCAAPMETRLRDGCRLDPRGRGGDLCHRDGHAPGSRAPARGRGARRQGLPGCAPRSGRGDAAAGRLRAARPPGAARSSDADRAPSADARVLGLDASVVRAMPSQPARGAGDGKSRRWVDRRSSVRDALRPDASQAHRRRRRVTARLVPDAGRSAPARASCRGQQARDVGGRPRRCRWPIPPADVCALRPARWHATVAPPPPGTGTPRGRAPGCGPGGSDARRPGERVREPSGALPCLPPRARGHPGGTLARNAPATVSPTRSLTTCQRDAPRPEPEPAPRSPLEALASTQGLSVSEVTPPPRRPRPAASTPPTVASSAAAARTTRPPRPPRPTRARSTAECTGAGSGSAP